LSNFTSPLNKKSVISAEEESVAKIGLSLAGFDAIARWSVERFGCAFSFVFFCKESLSISRKKVAKITSDKKMSAVFFKKCTCLANNREHIVELSSQKEGSEKILPND